MPARSAVRPYSRRISPDEWIFLAVPEGLGVEIQFLVEGDGTVDPADLAAALAAVGEHNPGTRLTRHGRRWVDSGVPPAVRVAEPGPAGRPRLDSPMLSRRLSGRGKPTCEVVLLRGTPTVLVFRAHHAVMDGRGVMFWLTQVFRALRGEPVAGSASPLTTEGIMAEIATAQGIELPPPVETQKKVAWESVLGPLPGTPHSVIRRNRVIDGYHPAVAAKVAREIAAYGSGAGLVLIPVDLRPYLPGFQTTGQSSGSVRLPVRLHDDWTDVQARLLTAMSEHEYLTSQGNPHLLRWPLPVLKELYQWLDRRFAADNQFVAASGVADYIACVSHMGRTELADVCTGQFEATSCYSLADGVLVPTVDIVESGGHTSISLGWRDAPGAAEHMDALLDQIGEALSPRALRYWDGNRTDRVAPPGTLTRLFAEQVARTPAAVAVSGPDGELSYAQLDQRASALAAELAARGVGRGDRVGLVSGRSAAAITAVWGVLKAGAAYIPIDAGYPDARIAQFLADAHAPLCLLEGPDAERACLPDGCAPLSLDALPLTPPDGWADASPAPDDLAYVVYTSGSTGAPKGVEIEHRNVVSYVRWAIPDAGIDASTRMLLIPSISFDVAGCAFFLPLLAGGAVLPVRDVNAVTLRDALENTGATAMAITPSHLDIINRAGVRHTTMQVVMTIGEVLRRSTAVRAREVLGPQCRILNQYGPAETTIVNTSHLFDPETDTEPGVPFGRPADNNTIHVLDAQGRFAAPGELGEACIGGLQVGRGYLGRPDLTRQRFTRLADGSRVYRTGDIVRLLPSGELTFVSRADDQVKVAGHRIEPAEIAQVLEAHPGVTQAAVVPRTRPGRQDKELCAYVVPAGDPDPVAWLEHLAARLPRYMIPATVTPVTEIPLNANGKVDAKRLPDPFTRPGAGSAGGAGVAGGAGAAAARDDVTAAVAAIWARTLQVDSHRIDEQSDFHHLGGNSLLLLTMIDEVLSSVAPHGEAAFKDELARVIREPTLGTVSVLAREIRDKQRPPKSPAL
jgi:amino acid adenylation domain-containing protein